MKHDRIVSAISIISLAALVLILSFTSPTEIGPLGVLLFFTTLYIAIFGLITAIMRLFYRFAFKDDNFGKKRYLYAAILAFGPIMLLMARSFGVITPWTVSLIVVFLFLAEFLAKKRI